MSTDDQAPTRLGIREAAARAGVSTKTIRHWIKIGRLPAQKRQSPYGDAYEVKASDLDGLGKVLSVVTVEKSPDSRTVALAVADVVKQGTAELAAEIAALRQQLTAMQSTLEAMQKERRPWWRRLFGGD